MSHVTIPVKWLNELLDLCGPEDHELRERVMKSAAPAAPSYPPAFGPNDWVMSVAGTVVKLSEWEPGAVKARTIYGDAAPAAPAVDTQDAARWRAFIASDRIRFFGWAGADSEGRKEEKNIYDEPNGNYVHFGAEFWSVHPARTEDHDTTARLLTTYADACIAAQAAAKGAAKGASEL